MSRRALKVLLAFFALFLCQNFDVGAKSRTRSEIHFASSLNAKSPGQATVTATFLGVATILFDDGETAIMTDGFFTRPGKRAVIFSKISPNRDVIARCLKRADVKHLEAVLVTHSHYDHALDCAEVVKQTGASLVGSESTLNIGRGAALDEKQMKLVRLGQRLKFGRFAVTFLPAKHAPTVFVGGEITRPIKSPSRVIDYREGESYSVLIEHDNRSILVQSTAGWYNEALVGRRADVIFLGIGRLGKANDKYQDDYWHQTVEAVGAKRVIPIHWDDFTLPLDQPLKLAPQPFDDICKAMSFVQRKGKSANIDVSFPSVWMKFDPFEAL